MVIEKLRWMDIEGFVAALIVNLRNPPTTVGLRAIEEILREINKIKTLGILSRQSHVECAASGILCNQVKRKGQSDSKYKGTGNEER